MSASVPSSNSAERSDLRNKMAIVTGASRGIGRAIALRLARSGVSLVLTARSVEALKDTASEVHNLGVKSRLVATPDNAPEPVIAAAVEAFGGLDILINNAGTTKSGDFLSLTDEDWAEGYKVKVFGAVRLSRAAWPELKKTGGS